MKTATANTKQSVLFNNHVGDCYLALALDKRNPARSVNSEYPLCMRFTVNGERYYYNLGESFTEQEIAVIAVATGKGERKNGIETNYEKQTRLRNVFQHYVDFVIQLNANGILTLDRIKVSITGKSATHSFMGVWEECINKKFRAGADGTALSYRNAFRSFKALTGFSEANGFALDYSVISRWVEKLKEEGKSSTTIGIYLRACRVAVRASIRQGLMMPKSYMFGKDEGNIAIPCGTSRKNQYLNVDDFTELYIHVMARDLDLPLFDITKGNPPYAVKTKEARNLIYQSLALFLAQYLCCGCNLVDLAKLTYDEYYYDKNQKAFRFIRTKTGNETVHSEGMEVIIPIIPELKMLLDKYAAKPKLGKRVFPYILDAIKDDDSSEMKKRVHQENRNIRDRLEKVCQSLGWTTHLTSTYARHSFATNLNEQEVPRSYISDAMGHSLGNQGQITQRYISPYSLEKRMRYNALLLRKDEETLLASDSPAAPASVGTNVPLSTKGKLLQKFESFSEEDLKEALIALKKKELQRLEDDDF